MAKAKIATRSSSPARSPAAFIRRPCRTRLPYTPDDIAAQSIAAAEAGRLDPASARARSEGRTARRPIPAVFMQFLPRIKQSTDAVINVTTGGGLEHDGRAAARRAARRQAGNVLAQHGLDELRHLPARRPLQDLEVRLGRALSARARTTSSSATRSATSSAS